MPSLRHSSATLSSPRKPAITMRTFSSAEYNRRVARLISRTAFSASSECVSAFDLISAPFALKMSQKPSLPQSLQTVQLVLTGNITDNTQNETEIRQLADALYRRVDWRWAQDRKATLSQGWKPECGFLHYGWEGYSEASILYVLAIASPIR